MNFFKHWQNEQRSQTEKGLPVANLAAHFNGLQPHKKNEFLQEFFNNKKDKDFLQQKMVTEQETASKEEDDWPTLNQIGDIVGLEKEDFKIVEDYFKEAKLEVEDNQKIHKVDKKIGHQAKGSVWRDRYRHIKKGPKVKIESAKTTHEISKNSPAAAGSCTDLARPEDVGFPDPTNQRDEAESQEGWQDAGDFDENDAECQRHTLGIQKTGAAGMTCGSQAGSS